MPLAPNETVRVAPASKPLVPAGAPQDSNPVIAAVALSGGGARAAAFGLGVLDQLKTTRFEIDGRQTTLLDETGLISGVSGGSVLATYYAAFGDEVFTRFEPEFLRGDFQAGLIDYILSPGSLYRLSSAWYGRSNALAERLSPVFRGKTFSDLKARRQGPRPPGRCWTRSSSAPVRAPPPRRARWWWTPVGAWRRN